MDALRTFASLHEANVARAVEWTGTDKIGLTFRGNELAGECGEACNVIKKLERERLGYKGSRASLGDLGDELSDVVICAYLTAMEAGIDLEACVPRKFNATSVKYGLSVRMVEKA